MTKEELITRIENDFVYHPPTTDETTDKFVVIRQAGLNVARLMVDLCPLSRELSLALTNLEQAVMWANSAIARNDK